MKDHSRQEGPPPARVTLGLVALGLASAAVYASFLREAAGLPSPPRLLLGAQPLLISFVLHFLVLFGLTLVAARLVWRAPRLRRGQVVLILGLAVTFRLLVVPSAPFLSSDIFRYVWDGRVQAAGINPYRYTPRDPALGALRDAEIWPRINRPWAPTVYPPGAEYLFLVLHAIGPRSLTGVKAAAAAADVGTIILLMLLLGRAGLPVGRAILYAWHPLPVFEFAGSGHVDALVVPVLLTAFSLARGRQIGAGIALGAATLLKVYPLAFLPVLWRRGDWRLPAAAAMVIVLGYLPVLEAGPSVLGFLPTFLVDPGEVFNPGLASVFLNWAGSFAAEPRRVITPLSALLVAAVGFGIWARRDRAMAAPALASDALWLGAAGLLLAATLHPWYLVWTIPLLCLRPRPAWIFLSGAVVLSYLAYLSPAPVVPTWVRAVEFVPWGLLLAGELARRFAARGPVPVPEAP